MNNITPIADIVKHYDALIFDIWGVIYDGGEPFDGAIAFLNQMIASNKKVVFLSNAPRPSGIAIQRFIDWGVNIDKAHVYTSGDYVREQLLHWSDDAFKTLGRKFYHLGAEKNEDILDDLDVSQVSDVKEADFILLSLYMDEDENLNAYDDLFKQAIDLKLPVVCANPDVTIHYNDKIRHCSGSFAAKYEKLGGVVHYCGKPNPNIFNLVLNKYLSGVEREKILMIGDTMETDIIGANKVGIDSALVLTGNGKDVKNACKAEPTWVSYGISE
jgi:HAD superfamily hydrolase (TIGR01459 family)